MSHYVKSLRSCWATASMPQRTADLSKHFIGRYGVSHWSRVFEYPWAAESVGGHHGHWVLDAAGGDGALQHYLASLGLQIVNVDLDVSKQPKQVPGVLCVAGDLRKMPQFRDGAFDQVVCVSVLEHIERPQEILTELWRVLKRGGRLTVTLDVADYARHNHTIDIAVAADIIRRFGANLPSQPDDTLSYTFPELQDGRPGRKEVNLNVLCFAADKG
jgi:2-polyprenyl-3-methyl-5-hydroxy-6-metoxy-1,4-benzoquinol methylase